MRRPAANRGPFPRALGVLIAAVAVAIPVQVLAADIVVDLDQAALVKLPERTATIVIGNPLIADAAVQSGNQMVITGKGYGLTNIIVLDRAGAVQMEKTVEVQGPRGVVVVYRGIERETYSCTPKCDRRITLGDSNTYFEALLAQAASRSGAAQGAVQASK